MTARAVAALLAAVAALAPAVAAGDPFRDGIMAQSIDRSVDPCEDFYRFACTGWMKANPVPPDQSEWDVGGPLDERNRTILRDILAKAAGSPDAETAKLGDYWAACMDEAAIERRGIAALKPELDGIAALADKKDLAARAAHLQSIGIDVLFSFGADQDAADATAEIAEIDQSGLGLPDRDYYTRTDADSVGTRARYRDHLAKMAMLAGEEAKAAAADAAAVLRFETLLAKASLTQTERIDPHATYHKLKRRALDQLLPEFDWASYLETLHAPAIDSLNVAVPGFLKSLRETLAVTRLDTVKAYLRLHLIDQASGMLPAGFVDESFAFYGRSLAGARELRPRWKRCVSAADADLGEELGRIYVRDAFPPAAKAAVERLIGNIKAAFAEDLRSIPWMGAETRARAEAKLAAMVDKIGYPDRWRDYSGLEIRRDDALGNRFRAAGFETARQLAKIGKPVDRGEWQMTPPTVNAYYDAQKNDINFPAGILQPPYFDAAWDDAVNYGATGATIGHEMTHGFDNSGRMFDEAGNLRNWWTKEDEARFARRSQCLIDEYGGFLAVPGLRLKGDVTLGENTADNGGIRLALAALDRALGDREPVPIDGFTPRQRFFVAYAQSWCSNQTAAARRLQALTDPHSPAEFRVNGVVRNLPEFGQAFACKPGRAMTPAKACRVW
jgi:endothelin-converting enzyme/putative endopeptidase